MQIDDANLRRSIIQTFTSIKNLLDIKDGGPCWLGFRQYTKINNNKNNQNISLVHFFEFCDISQLEESLV